MNMSYIVHMLGQHYGWENPSAEQVAAVDDTESDSEAPVPAPDDTESDSEVEESTIAAPVVAPVAAPVAETPTIVRPNVPRNCRLFSMRLQRRSAAFAGKRARAVHEDDTEDDGHDESEMPASHVQPEVVPAPKRVRKQAVLHNVSSF